MTTIQDRPADLRPVRAREADDELAADGEAVPAQPVGSEFFSPGTWSPKVLAGASQYALELLELQQRRELFDVMEPEELKAEKKLAAEIRAADRQRRKCEAEFEFAERAADLKARMDRAAEERAAQRQLEKIEHQNQIGAAKARALLNRLSDRVAQLSMQMTARKWAIALTTSPAAIAVLIGAVQVQQTIAKLRNLSLSNPLSWLLFGVEPLATMPLVAILICQATELAKRPDAEPSLDNGAPFGFLGEKPRLRQRIAERLQRLTKMQFIFVEVATLLLSVLINVGPHMLLGEPISGAAIWLIVPVALVLNLTLLPALHRTFMERIRIVQAEAELDAPMDRLSPRESRLLRQLMTMAEAELNGTFDNAERSADGLPKGNQVYKLLKATQNGTASREDQLRVMSAMREVKQRMSWEEFLRAMRP